MSYQSRLDAALALVKEHNDAVGQDNPGFVCGETFVTNLKALGATSEADLNSLTWEQVLKVLETAIPKPAPIAPQRLAQKICGIGVFRDEQSPQTHATGVTLVSSKKAEKLTLRQLVENFDPEEPDNPVGTRLEKIAKGRTFIIYKEGRTVDVEATFAQISALKAGHPPMDVAMVESVVKRVYRVGELPENKADENPLYPGRPLRPDGTCDQTMRSYAGVSKEVRQLLRFCLLQGAKRHGFDINNVGDAHSQIDIAVKPDAFAQLSQRHAKLMPDFADAVKAGKLQLEVELVSPRQVAKEATAARPFDQGQPVQWTRAGNQYVSVQSVRHDLLCRRMDRNLEIPINPQHHGNPIPPMGTDSWYGAGGDPPRVR